MLKVKHRRIGYEDRLVIENLFKKKVGISLIASKIGCSKEAIYREEERGWDVEAREYKANLAQQRVGIPIVKIRNLNKKKNEELLKKQRKEEE